MAVDPKKIAEVIGIVGNALNNEDVKKTIFGTYGNGKTRSVIDALNGEVLTPKEKKDKLYKKKKAGKKKIRL